MTARPRTTRSPGRYEVSRNARALAARCEPRIDELARRISRDRAERASNAPEDAEDAEIAATARYGLRLFARRPLDPVCRADDYRMFRERAAQRAEQGVPLRQLLRSHALGVYVLWQALHDSAGPGEEAALSELAGLLLRTQEGIMGAVAETYLDERAALDAERYERRRSVLRGLLDGTRAADDEAVRALGVEHGGLVLCLRVESAASATGRVMAERRRRRRLRTALEGGFGGEVLTVLTDDGGHAVVPGRDGQGAPEVPEGLVELLRRDCGVEVRLAAVPAATAVDFAEAARTAAEVIRVARACGRPPGLHRLDDVLLEFHLSRNSESSGPIAALLDPIADRPELLATLGTYLESQRDRRGTARQLGLHPNTVDNRLARIAELTGLDLSAPRGTALALAALLLRGARTVNGPAAASGSAGA
ncbi:PucR family transcriptional regulator [Streptantibioticus rubrisoli]|uniref:Helix-turn-helix domain-containing protein n=1 Tax=Streptantibioticus rubrisoli TaxID=1387313 RepID=A0ABT1P7I2_9ACTN|nr:PucR family transcriptional regulator [Streptantibioticus rubrisoli]MCQ4041334.1 helix-turn-helix domain-containing protein [Streptantibioticus rubrisoli]